MSAVPVLFHPHIEVPEPWVSYWLRQVTLRLRREIAWCWQQRAGQSAASGVPPLADPAVESLDLARYDADKHRFFATDVTARYLSEHISAPPPPRAAAPTRGSWEWVTRVLRLDDAAQFLLALGLAARVDGALGAVCSACSNDASRPYPTLALAQRLWDDPTAIVACGHSAHALFRHGLLAWEPGAPSGLEWYQPIDMPTWVAQTLLGPTDRLPEVLREIPAASEALSLPAELFALRLRAQPLDAMQVVPLRAPKDADCAALVAGLAARLGRRAATLSDAFEPERHSWAALAAVCWLRGFDVLLPEDWLSRRAPNTHEAWASPVLGVPVRWFAPTTELSACQSLPAFALLPPFEIPALTFEQRLALLKHGLGKRGEGLESALAECSRRFRFQARAVGRVSATLQGEDGLDAETLFAACRQEVVNELGHLAQLVAPRFTLDELVLPPVQTRQIEEIRRAMGALTEVHYGWGTARAWNEGGLGVLFSGPPGTGKTMAAECLAQALHLPMYRVDLSQVVNKYIGETEKNLKRIFDAAEASDCILFFDEADALFGKRTEVRDAHDRFANIEVSYLLERMERFKGLAILATNRRKDLDEAFTRRLRYIVEFPLPGLKERECIWRRVFPAGADTGELDFSYLAKQFPLSGGHIRSIAFNACLQSAAQNHRRVAMTAVLVAVKRELDKLNRAAHEELFGSYAPMIRELVA